MKRTLPILAFLATALLVSGAFAQQQQQRQRQQQQATTGPAGQNAAASELVEQTVEYQLPSGQTAQGFVVYQQSATEPRPGVLVIPEWWGLTEYPKTRARQLARMGYVAFVADMYGNGRTTENPQEAQQWSGQANETGLAELARPALEQLRGMQQVEQENLAAIGFCFGGSTVVAMATSDYGSQLQGVVSFHGGVGPDAAPQGQYNGPPMLILHGGADPMVPTDQFTQFVARCLEAQVPLSVVSFPGAVHAFSNPNATELAQQTGLEGIAYDEQAARQSWAIMQDFFALVFGSGPADTPPAGSEEAQQELRQRVQQMQGQQEQSGRQQGQQRQQNQQGQPQRPGGPGGM